MTPRPLESYDPGRYDRELREWRRPAPGVRVARAFVILVVLFLLSMIVLASLTRSLRSGSGTPVRLGPAGTTFAAPHPHAVLPGGSTSPAPPGP